MMGGPASLQQPRYEGLLRQMTPPQQQGKEGSALSGSITHGTPVHHTQHHLTPDKRADRGGLPLVSQGQGPVYDYYKRLSPATVAQNSGSSSTGPANSGGQPGYSPYQREAPAPQTTSAGGFTSPYPHQSTRPSASYVIDQQRQIIMNDYITSQQMHGTRRVPPGSNPPSSEKSQQDSPSPRGISSSPHYYSTGNAPSVYLATDGRLPRSSPANAVGMEQPQTPPHHTPPPPTRQGVIHSTPRHNTVPSRPPSSGNGGNPKPPSPAASPHQRIHHLTPHHPQHHSHHYTAPGQPPPGHEAFSSLVDVAVQQPSLPVPHKESDKRQQPQHLLPPHHPHHHEGLGKTMADSLNSTRMLTDHHQMQERERFSVSREQRERDVHHSAEQQRFGAVRESHAEQQRFAAAVAAREGHHPDRYSQSSREREHEQQRLVATSRDRERDRENHQIQQHRELQQQQQQVHLQQQIHQQQQARLSAVEYDQRQQRHHQHQQQMAYRAAAYRDHSRVSDIERETSRMLMGFQRDGSSSGQPQPPVRLHASPQQSQHGKYSNSHTHIMLTMYFSHWWTCDSITMKLLSRYERVFCRFCDSSLIFLQVLKFTFKVKFRCIIYENQSGKEIEKHQSAMKYAYIA